jgi:hypothetical protein
MTCPCVFLDSSTTGLFWLSAVPGLQGSTTSPDTAPSPIHTYFHTAYGIRVKYLPWRSKHLRVLKFGEHATTHPAPSCDARVPPTARTGFIFKAAFSRARRNSLETARNLLRILSAQLATTEKKMTHNGLPVYLQVPLSRLRSYLLTP